MNRDWQLKYIIGRDPPVLTDDDYDARIEELEQELAATRRARDAETLHRIELLEQRDRLLALVNRAIEVCQEHIIPDGISADTAMSRMFGIFDGPEQRAAMTAPTAEVKRGD